MKHIVSFSGGLGSFATAKRVIDWYGAENTILLFADTKIEDQDLYRFMGEAVLYLNPHMYVKLTDGRNPWEVFKDVRYQGNSRTAHCSKMLKTDLCKKWIKDRFKPDECVLHLGIGWDEEERLFRAQKNWEPYVVRAPMCESPIMTREGVEEILKESGIQRPRLYDMGFQHNNCGGFCVRAGQAHFANLLEKMPERYKWHEEQQEKLMEEIPTARPFIRKTIDGKLNYLTLKQFRESLVTEQPDLFDLGGCGCFVDDEDEAPA